MPTPLAIRPAVLSGAMTATLRSWAVPIGRCRTWQLKRSISSSRRGTNRVRRDAASPSAGTDNSPTNVVMAWPPRAQRSDCADICLRSRVDFQAVHGDEHHAPGRARPALAGRSLPSRARRVRPGGWDSRSANIAGRRSSATAEAITASTPTLSGTRSSSLRSPRCDTDDIGARQLTQRIA